MPSGGCSEYSAFLTSARIALIGFRIRHPEKVRPPLTAHSGILGILKSRLLRIAPDLVRGSYGATAAPGHDPRETAG